MSNPDIHIVVPSYEPNTATMNRIMAFLRGFSEQEVATRVTFLISDNSGSKVQESMPHIEFAYMWSHTLIKRRIVSQLQLEYNSRRYVRLLPKGAVVFLPWPSSRLMSLLVRRRDLKIYYDETELPELYLMRLFNIKSYLKSILKLNGVFVISNPLKDYFVEQGVRKENIHIVNMIVDTKRFDYVQKEKRTKRYIAYCGTVTSFKDGVDDLIKAFAIVHKMHPDVQLYIIGPIPQKVEENTIYKLVAELNLTDSIHFTGIIPYREMPQMLKNAEALALSRPDNVQAKYGFPTKLGEYLLTGNPVVLTNVGDIPLYLKDGVSALIAEPQNPLQFAEKLNWVIENKEAATEIGLRGKTVAEENFNYLKESKKIVEIINDTTNNCLL